MAQRIFRQKVDPNLVEVAHFYQSLGYIFTADASDMFSGGFGRFYSPQWMEEIQQRNQYEEIDLKWYNQSIVAFAEDREKRKESKEKPRSFLYDVLMNENLKMIFSILHHGKIDVLEYFNKNEKYGREKILQLLYLNAFFSSASRLVRMSNSDFWGSIGREGTTTREDSLAFHVYHYLVMLKPFLSSPAVKMTTLYRDNSEEAINKTMNVLEKVVEALKAVTLQERYRPYYRQHFERVMQLMGCETQWDFMAHLESICHADDYSSCFADVIAYAFEKETLIIPDEAKDLPSVPRKTL
ncbi:MAG: hypothetical protein WA056_02420 [Gallionella sp.]